MTLLWLSIALSCLDSTPSVCNSSKALLVLLVGCA